MPNIRKQREGKQKSWSLEQLKDGFLKFYEIYGHYPTAHEIDAFEFLPSSRSIQRGFGGLIELRQVLKLESSSDFRTGVYSSERAKKVNERAHTTEKKVYDYLVDMFGVKFVHREYFFTDDRRTRTDFLIYHKNGKFSVDVFYPSNKRNFIGCLNNKMRTYGNEMMLQYPVIFLQMNNTITINEISDILKRKKNKLLKYQSVMNMNEFKRFCESKKSIRKP